MKRTLKATLRTTAVVFAALMLGACGSPGGGNGSNPTPTPGDDDDDSTFDSQQAGLAAGQMKQGTQEFSGFYETDPSQANPGGSFFGPGCVENLSGDASDPDGDGYPNDATLTYDCSLPSANIISRGTISALDKQPNVAAFAFTASIDTEDSIDDVSATIKAGLDADESGNTYSLDVTDAEVKVDSAGTVALVAGNSSMSFTANGPWTPGDELVAGELSLSGTWRIEAAGSALVDTDVATTSPLVIDPTCDSQIVAGTLEGTAHIEAGGTTLDETFVLEWTGCDLVNATYNGDVVSVP